MNKPNYKDTLNLPHTSFSMRANLSQLEPSLLKRWEEQNLYQLLRTARKGAEKFILHDGPPYANGLIHIGHALNKILKDIIIKYKILQGFDCPYIVGWDCHGLPVEHQLFKKLKKSKHDVEIIQFRKQAKAFALEYVDLQRNDFKRLALLSDWDNPYLTLHPDYEYAVVSLLEALVAAGYVYRKRKPVNWCVHCETALAEAEVEYENHTSPSIYVAFNVQGAIPECLGVASSPLFFVIWTTTPWTLIANVAVAVHPKETYLGLKTQEGKILIVAKALKETFLAAIGIQEDTLQVVFSVPGKTLEGIVYAHPFGLRQGQVVLADYVSMEEGTGCVHTAPGHGQEDYLTGQKYGLETVMPVDEKGRFDATIPDYNGISTQKANPLIIERLQETGSVLGTSSIQHSYPHCWRCKKPIIFRATYQWFMNVDHHKLRQNLLATIETVRWIPSAGKERMRAMLVNRPDWCLSRQRYWGIPIPAVKCSGCESVILDKEIVGLSAQRFKRDGSDSWFTAPIEDFLPKEFSCPRCQGKTFEKEWDILDVWFESGASFLGVVKGNPELQFPADMYLEGSDQHRGWFQVSLIPSVATQKCAPYKSILTHGFVVDGQGRKMSKSLGNVIAPQKIIEQHGAEILRLWAAYADYSEDVKISPEIIKQLVDMYRKVRNTIKFSLGNLAGFEVERDQVQTKDLLEIDRYLLARTYELSRAVLTHYENAQFYRVVQEVFSFCNIDMSSFYLDILKDRLYTFSPKSYERRSAQSALYHIVTVLLKLMAPILSFTMEEAYMAFVPDEKSDSSIFVKPVQETINDAWQDETLLATWKKIRGFRDTVLKEIEKKREKGVIGSSLEAEVTLRLSKEDYAFYEAYAASLPEIFIVSRVLIERGTPEIIVSKSTGKKCLRCWNWRDTTNTDAAFPEICAQCAAVLKGGID